MVPPEIPGGSIGAHPATSLREVSVRRLAKTTSPGEEAFVASCRAGDREVRRVAFGWLGEWAPWLSEVSDLIVDRLTDLGETIASLAITILNRRGLTRLHGIARYREFREVARKEQGKLTVEAWNVVDADRHRSGAGSTARASVAYLLATSGGRADFGVMRPFPVSVTACCLSDVGCATLAG